MKKLLTSTALSLLILTLNGCASSSARQSEGAGGNYGDFTLVDVRLGMTESQIIEMFGDPTYSGAGDRRVIRVRGNKKLFCYGTDTSNDRVSASLFGGNTWTNVFRFENGELVEYFQMAENARQCETSTAID